MSPTASHRGGQPVFVLGLSLAWWVIGNVASAQLSDPPAAGVRLAFSSLRDRPAFASLYVYDHDGSTEGQIRLQAPVASDTSFTSSSLAMEGKFCLTIAKQVGGFAPQLRWLNVERSEFAVWTDDAPEFASLTYARLSRHGNLLAFSVWEQAGEAGGWDIRVRDVQRGRWLETRGLNTAFDERDVALSGSGEKIAFVSQRPDGAGLSDIYVYDRTRGMLVPTPGLNTAQRELNPSWNDAGTQLLFASDRPGGRGGLDLYLYSLETFQVSTLPELNSAGHEQSPSQSRSGRFAAFVSERASGRGNRDLFLADLHARRLLPTPNLNSPADDFDPSLEGP